MHHHLLLLQEPLHIHSQCQTANASHRVARSPHYRIDKVDFIHLQTSIGERTQQRQIDALKVSLTVDITFSHTIDHLRQLARSEHHPHRHCYQQHYHPQQRPQCNERRLEPLRHPLPLLLPTGLFFHTTPLFYLMYM